MFRLPVLVCVFHMFSTVKAGSHTLLVFATSIKGETVFPEFSALLMLDDMQLGYYDSVHKMSLRRGPNLNDPLEAEDQNDFKMVCGAVSQGMERRILSLRDHLNKTNGIQTLQRLTGCELLGDDKEGRMVVMEAFDGESGDAVYYNKHESSFLTDVKWTFMYSTTYSVYVKYVLKEVFHPLCMKLLRKYLKKEKNRMAKKVKPRVRLLKKTLPDSGGDKVTCLATGFYPRHINLTLLRDGQPVSDHQITGGELLPNGDETYQMRKSLEVSTEELQKHLFTCTAEHLSLGNMVNISIETEPHPDNLPSLPLLVSLLSVLVVCLISAIIGFVRWRRRWKDQGSHTSLQVSYTTDPE